jgi:hypothetical protein
LGQFYQSSRWIASPSLREALLIQLCFCFSLVNYANVMGLKADTGISGNQYSLLATIFYVTFLGFEFPSGYLGLNVCLWGVMVAANAGTII